MIGGEKVSGTFSPPVWAPNALLRSATIEFTWGSGLERAAAMMRRVYTEHPGSYDAADARYYEAVMYEWRGQPERARELYQAALESFPNHEGMQIAITNALKRLDK